MTKEKMIENYRNGVYNELNGDALFQIDLDDLIQSIKEDHDIEITELNYIIEDLEVEMIDMQEEMSLLENE